MASSGSYTARSALRHTGAGSGSSCTPAGSRSLQWDEAVIAEHDKDRGTRMKILEPKTPFRADMLAAAAIPGITGIPGVEHVATDGLNGEDSELRARLGESWEETGDDSGHDAWEQMESASAGYHGSASARMDVEGDDTGRDSSAPSSPLSATGSTSGASTGRSHSVLGYSTSHENLHAHFTDGAPVGAHVDSPSVAPAHREFTAKRRAHYGGEFAAVRALQARARVGDAQLDDEEAEDKE